MGYNRLATNQKEPDAMMPCTFSLIVSIVCQAPAAAPEGQEINRKRLEFMKQSVTKFDVRSSDDPTTTCRLQQEPVLRYTNSIHNVEDGASFLWLGEQGRPVAVVQVFLFRNGEWWHEFSSLSPGRVSAGEAWKAKPGVEFKPVPGAPKPAKTAELRRRQIEAFAEGFSVEQDYHHLQKDSWEKLRHLNKPLARYGNPDSTLVDGALIAYVLTTDPEVYLMLEVQAGKDGPEWRYAFSRASSAALRASWKGQEVWNLPINPNSLDSTGSYYLHAFDHVR
jgi:hypothetical protein